MLLDTNIVSEIWRDRPHTSVLAWLDDQSEHNLFICTPVIAELQYGIERLNNSGRKTRLIAAFEMLLADGYRGRVLSFDLDAAIHFGRIRANRDRLGRPIEPIDAMIAAIALANRMPLVTRNTSDFLDTGPDLIDPFLSEPS